MAQEEMAEKDRQSNATDRRTFKRIYIIVSGVIALTVILAILLNKNENQKDFVIEATKIPPETRAIRHFRAGEYAKAIQAYDEEIRKAETLEDRFGLYLWRGRAKFELGHYEAAVFDFAEAKAEYWLGRSKTELKKYSEAIGHFTTAIHREPDADAYLRRGLARLNYARTLGIDYKRNNLNLSAAADFTESIDRNPNDAWAYHLRGLCKARLGQREAAIYDFSEAIQLNGNYAWAYFERGENNKKLGRRDDATKDFDTAMKLAEAQGDTTLENKIRRARKYIYDFNLDLGLSGSHTTKQRRNEITK